MNYMLNAGSCYASLTYPCMTAACFGEHCSWWCRLPKSGYEWKHTDREFKEDRVCVHFKPVSEDFNKRQLVDMSGITTPLRRHALRRQRGSRSTYINTCFWLPISIFQKLAQGHLVEHRQLHRFAYKCRFLQTSSFETWMAQHEVSPIWNNFATTTQK